MLSFINSGNEQTLQAQKIVAYYTWGFPLWDSVSPEAKQVFEVDI